MSSIPLSIVDVFHPKHKHWAAYEKTFPRLAYFNGAARICFAAAYLPLRALYFPWVVVSQAIPDLFEVPRCNDCAVRMCVSEGLQLVRIGAQVSTYREAKCT